MARLLDEPDSLRTPCEKSLLMAAVVTPLPICNGALAPFRPSELRKTSEKLMAPLLKAVVLALAMLLPVTPKALELARRPDKAVENKNGILSSYEPLVFWPEVVD